MIYHQPKKKSQFLIFAPQAVLIAVISVFFLFTAMSGSIRYWSYKIFDFLIPERVELAQSYDQLLLLAQIKDLKERGQDSFAEDQNKTKFALSFGGGYLFLDTFFFNRRNISIKVGDWVLSGDIFLGKITELNDDLAKFKSLGGFGEVAALRGGENKDIVFEAKGMGGGELGVELPAVLDFKVGDLVWWGEDSRYVAGLIEEVRTRETSQAVEVKIVMPIKIERLTEVEILRQ